MSSDKRLNAGLKSVVEEGIREALKVCGTKYGFSALEAIRKIERFYMAQQTESDQKSLPSQRSFRSRC
jgi:hypothetical protein